MDITQFESHYPTLANVLPAGFWANVESDHVLKYTVGRDHTRALDYMSKLVQQTPWKDIRTSYDGELHHRNAFDSFFSRRCGGTLQSTAGYAIVSL